MTNLGNKNKIYLSVIALALMSFNAQVSKADESTGSLEIVGYVPTLFSVSATANGQVMDLSRGLSVSKQMIGMLHIIHNVEIASIDITSPQADALPVDASDAAPTGLNADSVKFYFGEGTGACTAFTAAELAATDIAGGGSLTPDATSSDSYCPVFVSYTTSSTQISTPGLYTMSLTVTMTSA